MKHIKKNKITPDSIKESIDNLPVGLCFYDNNGIPVLVNNLMNELHIELTNEPLQNGRWFSDFINEKTLKIGNKYYRFSNNTILLKNKKINQLTAYDITELTEYSNELNQYNKKLEIMNKNLKNYSKNVEEFTRNEEIFKAKSKIHDNLGTMLLETKIAVENNITDYDNLISKWKDTISLFQNTEYMPNQTDYNTELIKIADSLGIELIINGNINENNLYINAIKESVVNAVKYSDTKKITAEANENELIIINNGSPPKTEITETGGLLNLRNEAMIYGYTMNIEYKNGLKLIIKKVKI